MTSTEQSSVTNFSKTDLKSTTLINKVSPLNATQIIGNDFSSLNSLLIKFDQIDIEANTLEVLSSDERIRFKLEILNQTDIFKGRKIQ